MNILIIGNGFDLAHGLKTSYKDFLDYCNPRVKPYLSNFGVVNHFEKEEINVWLNYFLENQQALADNTWIDFENEIYNVIKDLKLNFTFPIVCPLSKMHTGFLEAFTGSVDEKSDMFMPAQQFNNEYQRLNQYNRIDGIITDYAEYKYCDNPTCYIFETNKGLINFLYDQLRDFTKAFGVYLTENVNNLSLTLPYQLYSSEVRDGQQFDIKWDVISFNYTNTFNRLYQDTEIVYSGMDNTVYVHGKASADDKDCDLVLGTHSFDRNGVDKGLPWDLNVFTKHNQRHKYGTIEAYQDLLRELKEQDSVAIAIIGHSLDKTDHNILKHIFTANENTVINIYYHDEKAHNKLINNITEIIGEAEVMAKVRLIYQHDEKRGLLRLNRSAVITEV